MDHFERKYLLRLRTRAIEHSEFVKIGKSSVAIVERLGEQGLAERVDFEGQPVDAQDPDATWQITEKGETSLAARR